MRVLITGAHGFIGRALCVEATGRGMVVRAATRRAEAISAEVECRVVGDVNGATEWQDALIGCEVVVHLAARAHVLTERMNDPIFAFRETNVDGALRLARQAAAAGVRRFVYLSTVGVNGAETSEHPFTELSMTFPHSAYSTSKHEAELGLQGISAATGMEVVVIRPPLVYGAEAPGNFGVLLKIVSRGLPLPLGAVRNKRSLVGLDNLLDFILLCICHPAAANQVFLVSDAQDISTPELIQGIGQAMGKTVYLLPVPVWALRTGAALVGRKPDFQRLCGNLQVDISKARHCLGWSPPFTFECGLTRAVLGWKDEE